MKTIRRKMMLLPAVAVLALIMISACSKDNMDDLEPKGDARSVDQEEIIMKSGNSAQNQLLAQVRRATARYQRVEVAIADGYEEAPIVCIMKNWEQVWGTISSTWTLWIRFSIH